MGGAVVAGIIFLNMITTWKVIGKEWRCLIVPTHVGNVPPPPSPITEHFLRSFFTPGPVSVAVHVLHTKTLRNSVIEKNYVQGEITALGAS